MMCCCLCFRHNEAVQCLSFNPVVHALMSGAWTEIGESVLTGGGHSSANPLMKQTF